MAEGGRATLKCDFIVQPVAAVSTKSTFHVLNQETIQQQFVYIKRTNRNKKHAMN